MALRVCGHEAKRFPKVKMFTFEIDQASDIPLWLQLKNRLVFLINSGHFKPGDQLPTVHRAASEFSINYNTVNKVYVSLTQDGYITSIRGRGAFVNDLDSDEGRDQARAVEQVIDECIAACGDMGLSLQDIEKCMRKQIRKKEKERAALAEKARTRS